MAHSYVDYRDNHIQLRDEQVFVVMSTIASRFDTSSSSDSMRRLVQWWTIDGVNSGPGCIEMPLDDILGDETAVKELESVLSAVAKSFKEHPELAKGDSLNALVGGERFRFENQDGLVFVEACEKIAELIVGKPELPTQL